MRSPVRSYCIFALLLLWTSSSLFAATLQKEKTVAGPTVTWRVSQAVMNDTPYVLRKLSAMVTEMTAWTKEPRNEIPPRQADAYAIENDRPAHGLAVLVTYGAYHPKTNAFVGMQVAQSGVTCDVPQLRLMCGKNHSWGHAWTTPTGVIDAKWSLEGPPTDFGAQIRFVSGKPPSAPPTAVRPEVARSKPIPNGVWSVSINLVNDSPFELRPREYWSSEGTQWFMLPPTFQPRKENRWMYINAVINHGPSALVLYDVYDPSRSGKYVGSFVVEGAVDCKGDYLKDGCLLAIPWVNAAADAVPGYSLVAGARPLVPLFALEAEVVIRGRYTSAK